MNFTTCKFDNVKYRPQVKCNDNRKHITCFILFEITSIRKTVIYINRLMSYFSRFHLSFVRKCIYGCQNYAWNCNGIKMLNNLSPWINRLIKIFCGNINISWFKIFLYRFIYLVLIILFLNERCYKSYLL